MKKKQLILICSAVLFVLVAVFSILAVKGARGEKQTVPAESSVSRQISSESGSGAEKDSSAAPAQKEENSSANRTAAGNEKEKNSNSQNAPQNPARETAAEKKETTQKQKITVTFSVTCKNALANGADVPQSGYIIDQTEITLKNGQTVFDALEAACDKNSVSLRYQSKSYITEIGGLAEKDCGGASGWMYRVNGTNPRKAASKYVLKDGDTVEWYYVTSASDN
ncbi:MAG TPA: DUF4430 domain-containing protein [Candidatus Eubacterium faecale]|uniref:DUF4430 domain-containing protein n=1 Tax=Candidatus Eubacterium faecale TaxID=2838568 RepID=A0A9D2MIP6_9FIRM|nr:DUF4430 domain-containing protein [Candidatus Eubacterium faecale]